MELDKLKSRLAKAISKWKVEASEVERITYHLAVQRAKTQEAYEQVRSLSDTINLIEGRQILAAHRIKIGRTTYHGPQADCKAAAELLSQGINAAAIRTLIKSKSIKLTKVKGAEQ